MKFLILLTAFALIGYFEAKSVTEKAIEDSESLDDSSVNDEDVIIDANSTASRDVFIPESTTISKNVEIGKYSLIGERCNIDNDVILGVSVTIGNRVRIRSRCVLFDYVTVEDQVKVGRRVTVYNHANISIRAEIGSHSILDEFSSVSGKLGQKVYVGVQSEVGKDANVNEMAVILNNVKIASGTNVTEKQVVISSPSSSNLYQSCEQGSIPQEQITLADAGSKNGTINNGFNKYLSGLLDAMLTKLNSTCGKGRIQGKLSKLRLIKSLYLIQLHGFGRFQKYKGEITPKTIHHNEASISIVNGDIFIDDVRGNGSSFSFPLINKLQNEYHFDQNAQNNILEPDVKEKFIQALVIEQDTKRVNRYGKDTVCLMIKQIIEGERPVMCAPSTQYKYEIPKDWTDEEE